jgi:hypothetical protein
MNMNKKMKWFIALLTAITACSLAAAVFVVAQRPDTDDELEVVKAPSHVSTQNGRTVITLDAQTQAQEQIKVTALTRRSIRAELRGTAVLLTPTELAILRNNYVAARAKVEQGGAEAAVSKSSYERIKSLFEQNQNMSLKATQDAEVTYRNSQAQLQAAEQDAKLQLNTVRQHWGTVIADWVAGSTPVLEPILEQREFLAQVTFPPGEIAKPPVGISLATPGKQLVQARLVSAYPQVSPQIQGVSFLYLVPYKSELAVGMNLIALVPIGEPLSGVVVPQGSVVWWQGKAWVYEQTAANVFTRREVLTDNPVGDGYFVPGAVFAPESKIVTVGAQALLSEEFRSEIKQQD